MKQLGGRLRVDFVSFIAQIDFFNFYILTNSGPLPLFFTYHKQHDYLFFQSDLN